MTALFHFLIDGGPIQMFPILALLILIIILLIKGFIYRDKDNVKTFSLVSSLALLAIVLGVFWQMIGLVYGFDIFSKAGSVSPFSSLCGIKNIFLFNSIWFVYFHDSPLRNHCAHLDAKRKSLTKL
ncbi:MAG: hypothetical protein Q7U08_01555 [Flavobacteriaceae bacterium]|nr:hypothetical protein [Flavobacteriaceae bacterium]